ncbi:MAG: ParB/RepB/Spo0J family partition protein [Magnetococcales bacterium]|nr:ParB/RepB/Spo0J family partition protein [Magnetococcales bacterium]
MASTLGRGLGSLLGEEAILEVEKEKVREVPLDEIRPNINQPRGIMDEQSLNELADSIRAQGVLQPILVRACSQKKGSVRYELVAGERRWRASKLAGLSKIPVLVRDWSDDRSLEVAILENVQREALNPVETAKGYANLISLFGYSHKKVGRRVGKSRVAVSNALRLLKLPQEVLEKLSVGALSMGHARALLGADLMAEPLVLLAKQVVEEGLSVRETEALVRNLASQMVAEGGENLLEDSVDSTEEKSVGKGGRRRDPMIIEMENRLKTALKAPVTITYVKGRGKIILAFDNPEMLESLTEMLLD